MVGQREKWREIICGGVFLQREFLYKMYIGTYQYLPYLPILPTYLFYLPTVSLTQKKPTYTTYLPTPIPPTLNKFILKCPCLYFTQRRTTEHCHRQQASMSFFLYVPTYQYLPTLPRATSGQIHIFCLFTSSTCIRRNGLPIPACVCACAFH